MEQKCNFTIKKFGKQYLNWFLQWIRNTTKTIPEKNHISWNQFQKQKTMKKHLEYGKRSKNIIAWNMEKVQDVL